MLLFLCGPHCSGKTTILKELKATGLVGFIGSELGKDLYYERRFEPGGQGPEFEREVLRLELDRDRRLAAVGGVAAVETWHPGNLAYAAVRNPNSVPELTELARESSLIDSARGVWLRIPPSEIHRRSVTFADDRNWAADFYGRIDASLQDCLGRLGLLDRTTQMPATAPLPDVVEMVIDWVRQQTAAGVQSAPRGRTIGRHRE